jgi:hypothetical protein
VKIADKKRDKERMNLRPTAAAVVNGRAEVATISRLRRRIRRTAAETC